MPRCIVGVGQDARPTGMVCFESQSIGTEYVYYRQLGLQSYMWFSIQHAQLKIYDKMIAVSQSIELQIISGNGTI